eukprot:1142134-Pelagomonas_calceolata.AAC.3
MDFIAMLGGLPPRDGSDSDAHALLYTDTLSNSPVTCVSAGLTTMTCRRIEFCAVHLDLRAIDDPDQFRGPKSVETKKAIMGSCNMLVAKLKSKHLGSRDKQVPSYVNGGDLQPDCSADRPVTGPRQQT